MAKDSTEKKQKKGLFSLFGGKKQRAGVEAPPPEPEEAVDAPPAEAEVLPEEVETVLPAADSQLYGVYCRINGVPAQPEDAVFDATMFHMVGLPPSEETMALLKGLDRNAAAMMKRWSDAELEPQNAEPVLLVSRDRMRVYLFAFPPMFGGEDLDEKGIRALLDKEKITFGINGEVLESAGTGRVYMRLILLASGLPPVDGLDGRVVERYRRAVEIRLTVRDDNTIDYRDLGWLQTANEGDVICEITPPTKAAAGFDVYNRTLPGRDGRKANVPKGSGTELNEEGTLLLAKIGGAVTFQSERFRVDPLVIIEGNVDIAVGHLDVVGDVLIKGDVQEGFKVKATGDITVNGGVEGATLEAGGSVQIGLGMNGNSVGSIQAGGEVYSKFFENTNVWAGKSIICDTIINSEIASEEDVLVTTGRGVIIGGKVTALRRVAAITVGNQSNRAMEIVLGNTETYLRERRAMEDARFALAAQIEAMQKDIRFLERQTDTIQKREKLNEINLQLKMGRLKFSKMEVDYKKLLAREANITKCRLQAEVLYPPLTITMGTASKSIRENVYNALVYQKDGDIHVGSL